MTYIFHDDPTERTNNHYSGVNVVTMCVEKTNSITSPVQVVLVEPFVQCGETYKELDLIILKDGLSFISPALKKINDCSKKKKELQSERRKRRKKRRKMELFT